MIAPAIAGRMQKEQVFPVAVRPDVKFDSSKQIFLRLLPDCRNDQVFLHRKASSISAMGKIRSRDGRARGEDGRILAQRLRRRPREYQKHNLKVVYDKSYPPSTTDFTQSFVPCRRPNPDIFSHLLLSRSAQSA